MVNTIYKQAQRHDPHLDKAGECDSHAVELTKKSQRRGESLPRSLIRHVKPFPQTGMACLIFLIDQTLQTLELYTLNHQRYLKVISASPAHLRL